MKLQQSQRQQGVSLVGLIVILALLSMVAMLLMKVVPVIVEYRSIKDAIVVAKAAGPAAKDIQDSFSKQRISGYFDAISSNDLEITRNGNEVEVSFAYKKEIPLVGPASLLFNFEGTTARAPLPGAKKPAATE